MLSGIPTPSNAETAATPAAESIVTAYCHELSRVAATLADLMDVTVLRAGAVKPADREALLSMVPSLTRLTEHLERVMAGGEPAPAVPAEPELAVADGEDFMAWVRREFAQARVGPPSGMSAIHRAPLPNDRLLPTLLRDVGPGVSIQGTTDSMPMNAVFELIEGGRKTGTLHVRTPVEHLRFGFDQGTVVAGTSNAPPAGARLGDILIRLGVVDEPTLAQALELVREEGVPLGAALIREGAVTVPQLEKALSTQLLELFERTAAETEAAYGFVANWRSKHDGKLRMSPRELLLETARRADELRRGSA